MRDLSTAIIRLRRMLDLDADPVAVDGLLRNDHSLAALVDKNPGRRVPRTVDAAEFAVRTVLGQRALGPADGGHAACLVARHGAPIDDPAGGLTHLFPDTATLTSLDPAALAVPRARRGPFGALVAAPRQRRA
jgi:AraC family transcriptional regulator of adaptative response / DNA-3-methyladenine glycosylase II